MELFPGNNHSDKNMGKMKGGKEEGREGREGGKGGGEGGRTEESNFSRYTCRVSGWTFLSRVHATVASTAPTPSNSSIPPISPSSCRVHWSPTST